MSSVDAMLVSYLTAMMFKNHSRYHLVVTVFIGRTGRAGGKGKGSLERLIQAAATALTAIAIGKEKYKIFLYSVIDR